MMACGLIRLHLLFVFALLSLVEAQQSFWPAAVPLAVRTPYLNTWQLTENAVPNPHQTWSQFWTRNHITAWSGFIRVDDTNYRLLGAWPGPDVNGTALESTTITPTRTIFRILCGPVAATVTFLSPVEVDNPTKQSLPFSYMYVDVESLDGGSHAIKLYMDISGEWVSSNDKNVIQWETTSLNDVLYHSVRRQAFLPQVEVENIVEDSSIYFATLPGPGVVAQTGEDRTLRSRFTSLGVLEGGKDVQFRTISDRWPVFAYSVDLGTITKSPNPAVWAIGQDHDPSLLYSPDGTNIHERSPYWKVQYEGVTSAIADFLADFAGARDRAIALDNKIMAAAGKISPKYADLVSLATRQTMAGLEITTATIRGGNWNSTDVKAFMKNIGARTARVNPVEVIYSAMPMFLYIDPGTLGHLLGPLLEYQASSGYLNPYAALDLGLAYPNATGNAREHQQGVEQSANMLIMSLAHAQYTGDGALLSRYYPLLRKWADYLVNTTLVPTNQVTGDGRIQPGNVNLAIKGIIALKAMSEISKAVSLGKDSENYSNIATDLVSKWQTQAMSNDRLLLLYENTGSDGLIYNLYADKLLKTNLIPEEVYSKQANHYSSSIQPVAFQPGTSRPTRFDPPYDSTEPAVVKPHWTIFTAAALRNYPIASKLIDIVHGRVSSNSTVGVFPASYRSDSGDVINGEASPALGAMFALLALDLELKSIKASPVTNGSSGNNSSDNESSESPANGGVIAGAVVGSLVGLAIIGAAGFILWRKKGERHRIDYNPQLMFAPQYPPGTNTSSDPSTLTMAQHQPRGYSTKGQNQTFHVPNTSISTAFTHPPISPTSLPSTRSGETGLSANAAELLRNEVADLRREMNQIRGYDEPPPSYPA